MTNKEILEDARFEAKKLGLTLIVDGGNSYSIKIRKTKNYILKNETLVNISTYLYSGYIEQCLNQYLEQKKAS